MQQPPGSNAQFSLKVPEGDDRRRLVCDTCGFVHYVNPRVVVGAVCTWRDLVLLCKRAIEPRAGFWTLPAGYLEERETTAEGAAREAREEACVEIAVGDLLAVYEIPRISQVQLIYRAELPSEEVAAGLETEEARLFAWPEIPWSELAFPSVGWALEHFERARGLSGFAPFTNPPGESGNFPARAARE